MNSNLYNASNELQEIEAAIKSAQETRSALCLTYLTTRQSFDENEKELIALFKRKREIENTFNKHHKQRSKNEQ